MHVEGREPYGSRPSTPRPVAYARAGSASTTGVASGTAAGRHPEQRRSSAAGSGEETEIPPRASSPTSASRTSPFARLSRPASSIRSWSGPKRTLRPRYARSICFFANTWSRYSLAPSCSSFGCRKSSTVTRDYRRCRHTAAHTARPLRRCGRERSADQLASLHSGNLAKSGNLKHN